MKYGLKFVFIGNYCQYRFFDSKEQREKYLNMIYHSKQDFIQILSVDKYEIDGIINLSNILSILCIDEEDNDNGTQNKV